MSLLAKSLRDQRLQILGFGISLLLIAVLDVLIYPTYRDELKDFDLPPALEGLVGNGGIASPQGFLSAEFFSWIVILLIVYAVIQGTGAIAGEESSGTMDLLLAQPVARRDIVLQKTLAVVAGSAVIVAIGYIGFVITMPFIDMDLGLDDVAVACANMLPITLAFYALSLWLGAVAPSRAAAAAIVIGIATAGYFLNLVAAAVSALEWLQYLSPFYYYGTGEPLTEGINWWHAGLLLGTAALLVALALRSFEHRDVSVGGAEVDLMGTLRRAIG